MPSQDADLDEWRHAVAVIVHARHHLADLTTTDLFELDEAISHLQRTHPAMPTPLAAWTSALLSNTADPRGERTARAIDQLADIVAPDPAPATDLPNRRALHDPRSSPLHPT